MLGASLQFVFLDVKISVFVCSIEASQNMARSPATSRSAASPPSGAALTPPPAAPAAQDWLPGQTRERYLWLAAATLLAVTAVIVDRRMAPQPTNMHTHTPSYDIDWLPQPQQARPECAFVVWC